MADRVHGSSFALPVYVVSKPLTFSGVLFPTLGRAIAGIRFFGFFERVAGISEVTSSKLTQVEKSINNLLASPAGSIHFRQVADIVHALDETVIAEIENWQAVFGGKQITLLA